MVGGGRHRADAVGTSWETPSDSDLEVSLTISRIVDSLKESKGTGVKRCRWVHVTTHVLNAEMGMADNYTAVELLRRCVVCDIGIGE